MVYVPIRSIARTDQSGGEIDPLLLAVNRSVKSVTSTDESECDVVDINFFRALRSRATTDFAEVTIAPTFLRSLRSRAETDTSGTAIAAAVQQSLTSVAKTDESAMEIPGAGALHGVRSIARTDESGLQVLKLSRGLGLPPSGSVSVLWSDGDRSLERLQIRKGCTYSLNIRITDERFSGYVASLEASVSTLSDGFQKIVLSSDPKVGGLDMDGATIAPIETKLGPSQELIVSAEWRSEYTADLPANTIFDYRLLFDVPLFGEKYVLQSGQFLVVA